METINKIINFIGKDKILHFICCFLIVIIVGVMSLPVIGLSAGIIVALLKETYDEFREGGTGWDWKDIIADFIGIILGILIIL